jgi:hypothetical protein
LLFAFLICQRASERFSTRALEFGAPAAGRERPKQCLSKGLLLTLYDLFVSNSADDARRKSAKTINFRPPLALPPPLTQQIDPQNVFLPRVASQQLRASSILFPRLL